MEKGKFMEFNERLRYLIDCEEIKIKDLAPKLCLSASTLSNYTQGIREPDYDTLRRIADYFGVSIDYLLGHKSPVTDDERQLLALLDEIRTRYDLSILISTHDFNTLHKMDKVILLKQKVLQMGTPEEVLASQEFQTLFYHPTQKGGDAQ